VICNVGVLTTGFDADVRCIILARPTKSEMLYVQMIGRGLRPAKGKDHCLVLDHSDTTIRLGFVTDIHHDALDDGSSKKKTPEKKEKLPKECPKCAFLRPPKVRICPSCGFEAQPVSEIESVMGELHEITRSMQVKPKDWSFHEKEWFYRELLGFAHNRGYKEGWAYHAYRARLGVGPPNAVKKIPDLMIRPQTMSWIKHYNIVKAKQREKANEQRTG